LGHFRFLLDLIETFLDRLGSSSVRPRDGLSLKPDRAISALLTP
jgi:hypothetical protein